MRYKIVLFYEGGRYKGWQSQAKGEATIHAELLRALKKVFGQVSNLSGASRTDAGVHALGQTAHFDVDTKLSEYVIAQALNHHLPSDIGVGSVKKVSPSFHARYHATRKHYRYRIYCGSEKPVFYRNTHWWFVFPLDREAMRRAAKHLIGKHDFRSFTTTKLAKDNCIREITQLKLSGNAKEITLDVHGSGFLHHMVRIIAGTLVEVGKGKKRPEEISTILAAKDRRRAGLTAPAHGLTLVKVYY